MDEQLTQHHSTGGRTWVDGYRRRLDDIGDRAEEATRALAEVTATASSLDDAVRITADAAGRLLRVELGPTTGAPDRQRLAAAVLQAGRQAQAEAATRAAAALAPLTDIGPPPRAPVADRATVHGDAR